MSLFVYNIFMQVLVCHRETLCLQSVQTITYEPKLLVLSVQSNVWFNTTSSVRWPCKVIFNTGCNRITENYSLDLSLTYACKHSTISEKIFWLLLENYWNYQYSYYQSVIGSYMWAYRSINFALAWPWKA